MKNKIITLLFILFIFGFLGANLITKKETISYSERRTLRKLPDVTVDNIINGNLFDNFEDYALDHFVLRDDFRALKSLVSFNVLAKKDNNDLYYKDGYIYKIEYPLKENKIENFTKKINKIYEEKLKNLNVYYSIIPDKNYYVSDDYLKLDYDKLIKLVNDNMHDEMTYIDIINDLDINSYYRTDIHWRQEELSNVVNTLSKEMYFKVSTNYKENTYDSFKGSYYGQIGLKVKEDILTYLSNDITDNAQVFDIESDNKDVYEASSLGGVDSYDIFLGGASSLVEITNTDATTSKELVIFRDSFASSLTPLLIEGYKKITLVDLRYMDYSLIDNYIKFKNQDVLFLYNTTIINNSDMIKVR